MVEDVRMERTSTGHLRTWPQAPVNEGEYLLSDFNSLNVGLNEPLVLD